MKPLKVNKVPKYCGPVQTKIGLCSVYVVAEGLGGPTKIGIANDFGRRFPSYATANPRPVHAYYLRWVQSKAHATRVESLALDVLKKEQVWIKGEWFECTPEAAALVIEKALGFLGFSSIDDDQRIQLLLQTLDQRWSKGKF